MWSKGYNNWSHATNRFSTFNSRIKVSGKVALVGRYTVGFIDDIDIVHEKVKKFCEAVNKFTDKEIQYHLIAERIIPALNAKQTLKEVRAKTGRLIWRR